MDQTGLLKDFSNRIYKYRQSRGYSSKKMAAHFGVKPLNYYRYENGANFPGFWSLYCFAAETGISLDWLVCSKGPMYYGEKMEKQEKETAAEKKTLTPESGGNTSNDEIKGLVEHMERIPLLRHEILASFYKFKENNKKMLEKTGTGRESVKK